AVWGRGGGEGGGGGGGGGGPGGRREGRAGVPGDPAPEAAWRTGRRSEAGAATRDRASRPPRPAPAGRRRGPAGHGALPARLRGRARGVLPGREDAGDVERADALALGSGHGPADPPRRPRRC